MNKKNLLWYVFDFLESKEMVEHLKIYCEGKTFNYKPLPGEITVKAAVEERYKAYTDAKRKKNE